MSMTPRLLIVCGVRPQYVKAAALDFELGRWERLHDHRIDRIVVDTGQHYSPSMAAGIQQDLDLKVGVRFSHSFADEKYVLDSSVRQLDEFIGRFSGERVTMVVFGDANPAYVGAVAAKRHGCRLVHVEAGERRHTSEREDYNTREVDRIATLALCVTHHAVENLRNEGFSGAVVHTGDLAYRWFALRAATVAPTDVEEPRAVVTLHRPQHLNPNLIEALATSVRRYAVPRWVLHPRSGEIVRRTLRDLPIEVMPEQSFEGFMRLIATAAFVVSDSGGVIREAHLLGKPVIAIRDCGGWEVLDNHGSARHVGSDLRNLDKALAWASRRPTEPPTRSPLVDIPGLEVGIASLAAHCV